MTDKVEARRTMSVRQLYDHMATFVSDNGYSNDVDVRWLVTQVEGFSATVGEVMNSRLGPQAREQVNDFRAGEIEKELEKKRQELVALERDLKRVKPVKAA